MMKWIRKFLWFLLQEPEEPRRTMKYNGIEYDIEEMQCQMRA